MNLLPTPIVDKNGVMTTRYKGARATNRETRNISSTPPAPSPIAEQTVEELEEEARQDHAALIDSLVVKDGLIEMGGKPLKRHFTFYSERGTKITVDGYRDAYRDGGMAGEVSYSVYEHRGDRRWADDVEVTTPSEVVEFMRDNYVYDGDKYTYEKSKSKADASRAASKARRLAKKTEEIKGSSSMTKAQFEKWFESEAAARGLKKSRY